MDFRTESLPDLAEGVRTGARTARALVEHALRQIETHNPAINAFVALDPDAALLRADDIDAAVANGRDPGPLAGIPIGVKDLEDAAEFVTTYGSPFFEQSRPAPAHSILVERLVAAGAIVVGKTNTPDFGWTGRTENPVFGTTTNPWNQLRSPGGSSGGTAAALASGMVPLATGSDGGGSIRIPAAATGLSGFKASLGRVPAGGNEPPSWLDLSSKGPMARRLSDTVYALNCVVGPDPSDLTSLPAPPNAYTTEFTRPPRIIWSPTLGYADVDDEVARASRAAIETLAAAGADVIEVDRVFDDDPVGAWLTIVGACLARTITPFASTAEYGRLDPILSLMVDGGAKLSAIDLVDAFDTRHRLGVRLATLLEGADVLACPTTAGITPTIATAGMGEINGSMTPNWVQFTYPFNLTRSPAASVPISLSSADIPLGLQLVGPHLGDDVTLAAAAFCESALGFDRLAPGFGA